MVCNPTAFLGGGRLDITRPGRLPPRKQRRVAKRVLDESVVKLQLKAERKNFMDDHPSLAIIGEQLVCPDSVISQIYSNAKYISVLKIWTYSFFRLNSRNVFLE